MSQARALINDRGGACHLGCRGSLLCKRLLSPPAWGSSYPNWLFPRSLRAALEIADHGYVLEPREEGEAKGLLGNARVQASYLGGGH